MSDQESDNDDDHSVAAPAPTTVAARLTDLARYSRSKYQRHVRKEDLLQLVRDSTDARQELAEASANTSGT